MAGNETSAEFALVELDPNGTDLPVTNPDSGILRLPAAFNAISSQKINNYSFQTAQIAMQIHLAVQPQLQQRIAHQLTGPVICNISSPVDFKQRNAFFFKLLGAEEKMFRMLL
ncbi:hypothetical protein D3C85_1640460 [compost metagenome]